MATRKLILLEILETMNDEDFGKFRWLLSDKDLLKPFPAIREYQVGKANRMDTVTLIVNAYSEDAVDITLKVLRAMLMFNHVKRLLELTSPSAGGDSAVAQGEDGDDREDRGTTSGSRPETGAEPEPGLRPRPDPGPERQPGPRVEMESSEAPDVPPAQQQHLDPIFTLLEENIVRFVKSELKKLQNVLSVGCLQRSETQSKDEEQRSIRESFLTITLNFLRRMEQKELADRLQSRICQHKLKSNLVQRYGCLFDGFSEAGNPTLLNQIYTDVYVTDGCDAVVNMEHEVLQLGSASRKPDRSETSITSNDMFKSSTDRYAPIRTVLTRGVPFIGKTVLTHKFILDWAEGKANQDIEFIFPFTFRELNVLKGKRFSLVELVHLFFSDIAEAGMCSFEDVQVVFIFDGLDECRLPLDFNNTHILTDVTESTWLDVLLVNLIRGELLPSARLWITTRPAGANQIPNSCIDRVTNVRGFTDPQKEEYFRKRFRDEEQANTIISHIKTSRSLHIMCHIPLFCWLTAGVLEKELKKVGELSENLTEMYIHFLVVQVKQENIKYDGRSETDPHWSPDTRKMMESLAKLAFEHLQKGNLIFYESDLTECGIDIRDASVCSGVFTEIITGERALFLQKLFSFVHLSVQEFLAALHVHQTFINTGVNLLEEQTRRKTRLRKNPDMTHVHQAAVDKALQSPNGHLDLFLRFLLGLSLPTYRSLLHGLLPQIENSTEMNRVNQKTAEYIKKNISTSPSAEKSINLFHCLYELGDRSLVDQIQQYLSSGHFSTDKLSPAEWSALVFILLSADEDLEMFDLKKYSASEDVLLRLLPVVKASRKAVLSDCNLSERSCDALSSVLCCRSCGLLELDMSNNDLGDSGLKLLCSGLQSPGCKLETLRLSGCLITKEGFDSLASVLRSNPLGLKELDLSYNCPSDVQTHLLCPSQGRLFKARLDPAGPQWLKPGLKKYYRKLTLDTNTAHTNLRLSDDGRTAEHEMNVHAYPRHSDRFDRVRQLLCSTALTGRCCWEVQWSGGVRVAVTYRGISRKGHGGACVLGGNDQSWSLSCCDDGYSVHHDDMATNLRQPASSSGRVLVYVDHPAGSVSFYRVSSDKPVHLHTFHTTFTEPLYAGFWLWSSGSSVTLCDV